MEHPQFKGLCESTAILVLSLLMFLEASCQRQMKEMHPSEDSWYAHLPIDDIEFAWNRVRIPSEHIWIMPDEHLDRAIQMLSDAAILDISRDDFHSFLGWDIRPPVLEGYNFYLARGLWEDHPLGGFMVYYYKNSVMIMYNATGPQIREVTRRPVIIMLPKHVKPKRVYVGTAGAM